MTNMQRKRVAIVGCGVSGIASAHYLTKKYNGDVEIEFFESSKTVGGRVGSKIVGSRVLDFGGKNIGYKYTLFREFLADQGCRDFEYFGVNTSKIVEGKLIPISREKNLKSIFNLLKMASPVDLIKMFFLLKMVKKDSNNSFLDSDYFNKLADQYDSKPITKYFSKRCCDNILRAMTVRMNGAEPEECYIGNIGTNISSAFDKYEQVKSGIDNVIKNFLKNFKVNLNTSVVDIVLDEENKITGIEVVDSLNKTRKEYFDTVILALPACTSAEVLKKRSNSLNLALKKIKYNPVLTLIAQYEDPVFSRDVRAVIFDQSVSLSNAGAYGINDLNLVRYTFSGNQAKKLFENKIEEKNLFEVIEKNISDEINVRNNKMIEYDYEFWQNGLCAYSQYHHKNLEHIRLEISKFEGLYLTGDYFKGASIEACFQAAKDNIERIK